MLRDIVVIGDKIEINKTNSRGHEPENTKRYVSQLLDYVDTDVINIAMPIDGGKIIPLEVGESYNLCFYASKGLFQCTCNIINRTKEDNIYTAVAQITSELEKIQRRQFYRMECLLDVEYRIISREESLLKDSLKKNQVNQALKVEIEKKLKSYDKDYLKASITDLSGGGARFTSDISLQKEDKLVIKLALIISGIIKNYSIGAEVISSTKLLNRIGKYENRVEFRDIGKKEREEIIKYIFEQERQKRRNV